MCSLNKLSSIFDFQEICPRVHILFFNETRKFFQKFLILLYISIEKYTFFKYSKAKKRRGDNMRNDGVRAFPDRGQHYEI